MDFVEFPKWLHFDGEPSVLVQDAEEEAAILAAREPADPEPKPKGQKAKAAADPEPTTPAEPAAADPAAQ